MVETSPRSQLLVATDGHAWIRPAVLSSTAYWSPSGAADQTAYRHVQALFIEARYDWNDPLSARSFSKWREGLSEKHDYVTEIRDADGKRQFFRVRTRTSASILRAASLTLRADTLRAVNGAFDFAGSTAVQISQQPQPAPEPYAVVRPPRSARIPSPKAAETLAGPEDELRVFAAPNSIGADAGEPITVDFDATKHHIVVSGMGIAPERQREIAGALSKLPVSMTRFDSSPPHSIGQEASQKAEAFAAPTTSLLHQLLEGRGGGPRQLQQIVDDALEASSSALAQAHALWTLAEKFPPPIEAGFDDVDRQMLRVLRQKHAATLENAVQRLREVLKPLLSPPAGPTVLGDGQSAPPNVPEHGAWQNGAQELFDVARASDELLNRVLAASGSQSSPPGTLGELSDRLDKFQKLAQDQVIAAR